MSEPKNEQEPWAYFTIRIPESLRGKLDRLAKKNERSTSAEVRVAIYNHLSESRADQRTFGDLVEKP